ncbi:MAG: hypothetical protein IGBAC_1130 [Ignavibacteriae bacterium]|nr:MAG: hypothetical protein IGBAC_1130 [Ignavibacteriota bacterium]
MRLTNKIITASKLLKNKEFYYLIKLLIQNPSNQIHNNLYYINLSINWLLKANIICDGNGFSKLFSLRDGWFGPYAETTGYIIPTLYSATEFTNYKKNEIYYTIQKSADWLLSVQYNNGAFGDSVSFKPKVYKTTQEQVFDTGQAIFGLISSYEKIGKNIYLDSAVKAGNWLLKVQDESGSWTKFVYNNIPHTYYSRVAFALCKLWEVTGVEQFKQSALKNVEWVIKNQKENGAFLNCSFLPDNKPVLHVIAYTIEGLWKSGLILKEELIKQYAIKSASILKEIQKRDKILFSHYNLDWEPVDSSRCLTGLAQMAEIWLSMYDTTGDEEMFDAAVVALNYLKQKIITNKNYSNLHGGLLGSFPWWGKYFPWAIPNWGNKFFIDALLLEEKLNRHFH